MYHQRRLKFVEKLSQLSRNKDEQNRQFKESLSMCNKEIRLSSSMVFTLPRDDTLNKSHTIAGKYYMDCGAPIRKFKSKSQSNKSVPSIVGFNPQASRQTIKTPLSSKRAIIPFSSHSSPLSKYIDQIPGNRSGVVPMNLDWINQMPLFQNTCFTPHMKNNDSIRDGIPPTPHTLLDIKINADHEDVDYCGLAASLRQGMKGSKSAAIINMLRRNVKRDRENQPEKLNTSIMQMLFPKSSKQLGQVDSQKASDKKVSSKLRNDLDSGNLSVHGETQASILPLSAVNTPLLSRNSSPPLPGRLGYQDSMNSLNDALGRSNFKIGKPRGNMSINKPKLQPNRQAKNLAVSHETSGHIQSAYYVPASNITMKANKPARKHSILSSALNKRS